jgi:hypothetical protein
MGWGGADGRVTLPPAHHFPDWNGRIINRTNLVKMVAHEVLHTFGLTHDESGTTEPEVMHGHMDATRAFSFGPWTSRD